MILSKKQLITLILAILICASSTYAETVQRVIDGDTLKLASGERLRLIGVDTPESRINDKAKRDAKRTGKDVAVIAQMGQESTRFVKGLIPSGEEVYLEYDIQKKDRYGRTLAYVYLDTGVPSDQEIKLVEGSYLSSIDGNWHLFVNATLVKSGYAQPMTIPPNVTHAKLFKNLHKEAIEKNRGLYKK